MDFQLNEVHARYFRFSVGDEMTNYTLYLGGYDPSSDAGKYIAISFSYHFAYFLTQYLFAHTP